MGYITQAVTDTKKEFEEYRKEQKILAEARRNEIWLKIPSVKQIDDRLSQTGMRLYETATSGTDDIEQKICQLKKENLELQQARADLLLQFGYPADYTKVKYRCEKCNDSGYIGIDMCPCMKTAIRKKAYLSSGLGKMLDDQCFENFDLSYYPETVAPHMSVTCRENMEFILNCAKKYVKDFNGNGSENLIFYGDTGLGKTHISTCIAKGLIDKGFEVIYDTAQNILKNLENEKFKNDKESEMLAEKYTECDFLIIDDLGAEFKSNFSQSALYNLINTRICSGSPMLISTNLDSPELLSKTYEKRFVSRLIGAFRSFMFTGEDIRMLKSKRK